MDVLPALTLALDEVGRFTGWAPHRPDLRRRRADTSALVFILVVILAPNAFVDDVIGTTTFAILGGASIWALLMVFPPTLTARTLGRRRAALPSVAPSATPMRASRVRRGPISVGLIATAVMIAGSPSSMASTPILAIVVAVIVGAIFFTAAAALQIFASAPLAAPPAGSWPRAAPTATSAVQRGQAGSSAPANRSPAVNPIGPVVERYTGLLHSTEPANRPVAEAAIGSLYRAAGVEPPPCVWVRSPREAMLVRAILRTLPRSFGEPGMDHERTWQEIREACPAGISSRDWDGLIENLKPALANQAAPAGLFARDFTTDAWDPPDYTGIIISSAAQGAQRALQGSFAITTVSDRHEAAISYALGDEAAFAGVQLDQPTGLPQSINRLIAAEHWHEQWKHWEPAPRTGVQISLLETCGGWWPTPLAVVLSERPVVANRDARGMLHSTDGPALVYADGWRIYANRGTPLPRVAFEHPDTIDIAMIRSETNVARRGWLITAYGSRRYLDAVAGSLELITTEPDLRFRRMAIDGYGVTRFVQETGAVIDTDLDGQGQVRRLWRATRERDDPIVLVEVVNSTPEPDGSRHHYWLRVPPDRTRCQDAVAWTFGVNPADYHPEFES